MLNRTEIKYILSKHGNDVVGEVKLSQIYQGMRGITGLLQKQACSMRQEGIRFRGYSIPELREKLPKANGGTSLCLKAFFILLIMEKYLLTKK
jgi:citrate synthase